MMMISSNNSSASSNSPWLFLPPPLTKTQDSSTSLLYHATDHWLYYLSGIYVLLNCATLLTLHICGILYWLYNIRIRKCTKIPSSTDILPGISIIKPLVAADANTKVNLESFFKLEYPKFQLIICLQNANESTRQIVNGLVELYKGKVDVEIYDEGGDEKIHHGCVNPKIANITDGYNKAKYELVMISDSRIILSTEAMLDVVNRMTDGVGIVHQMPFTVDVEGFPHAVEKVCFGTQQARLYTFLNLLGAPCLTGMSFLFRKSVIDSCGGISAFGSYLAEDFFIGKAFTDRNWKMRLSTYPAMQNPGSTSLQQWIERMVRWCQLRVRLSPIAWLEPLQDCIISAFLTSTALYYMHSFNILLVFLSYISIWFVLDIILLLLIQKEKPLLITMTNLLLAWAFREISSVYIFTQAVTNSHVIWRTYKIKIGWSTKAMNNSLETDNPV